MFKRFVTEVREFECGLLYQGGKFQQQLTAGRYAAWEWEHKQITLVDMRECSCTIDGQEVLTSDKIGVRITLIAQYAVVDPVLACHAVEDYRSQLYQDLQLSLRENISNNTLEVLLQDRSLLATGLQTAVTPLAEQYGLAVKRVGVKDIMLPNTVRSIFLQEVEADLKGRASLVAARHEVAAARARANTAKILQENPDMLQLKMLETISSLADKEGNVLVIPGLESLLQKFSSGQK